MLYPLLKFTHLLGAILIGSGLISVWLSDLRSRQLRELPQFCEAVRNIVVFYDGVVVPGPPDSPCVGNVADVKFVGGWNFVKLHWPDGIGTINRRKL